jgi:serine phosphatase RsbU (regulator of sigma subunit)
MKRRIPGVLEGICLAQRRLVASKLTDRAIALSTGVVVLAIGMRLESAVIAAVGAQGHELEWISDVTAALAVTAVTYLWLNLRTSQMRILDLERARIARDEQLKLAAEIQGSLLPAVPAATPGYLWSARMEAAHEVGGDFYDMVRRADGSVLIIVGDVSGKGVPAALLQSSLLTLFRVHASQMTDPVEIAGRMSEDLHAQTGGHPYATAIVARFDRGPERITYVNAGHPPAAVWRGADAIELKTGGPPLGLLAGATYDRASIDLLPGDVGVFVTDGITEALGASSLLATQTPLDEEGWQDAEPQAVCDRLLKLARSGGGPSGADGWTDDRTVLVFRVQRAQDTASRAA